MMSSVVLFVAVGAVDPVGVNAASIFDCAEVMSVLIVAVGAVDRRGCECGFSFDYAEVMSSVVLMLPSTAWVRMRILFRLRGGDVERGAHVAAGPLLHGGSNADCFPALFVESGVRAEMMSSAVLMLPSTRVGANADCFPALFANVGVRAEMMSLIAPAVPSTHGRVNADTSRVRAEMMSIMSLIVPAVPSSTTGG